MAAGEIPVPPEAQEQPGPKIEYTIEGDFQQVLRVDIPKGMKVYSDTGSFRDMDPSIEMTARIRKPGRAILRVIGGETLFQNEYLATEKDAHVTLNSKTAGGKIVPVEFGEEQPDIFYKRGALVSAEEGVNFSLKVPKNLFTGLFGGQGLLLAKLTGEGKAHLISDGDVSVVELGDENSPQELIVDQGYLVAFEEGVNFEINRIKGGLRNWLFSGEGIFATKLSGKGKVWLQTRNQKLNQKYGANMDLVGVASAAI